jgi:hypothetical protein
MIRHTHAVDGETKMKIELQPTFDVACKASMCVCFLLAGRYARQPSLMQIGDAFKRVRNSLKIEVQHALQM